MGLMDYHARWYGLYFNHFVSADTIVLGGGNPQVLNRYAYVVSNPIRNIDPTGHAYCSGIELQGCNEPDVDWQKRGAVTTIDYYIREKPDTITGAFVVWWESSESIFPEWALNWISHNVLNRYANYYSSERKVRAPFDDAYTDYFKYGDNSAIDAVQRWLREGNENWVSYDKSLRSFLQASRESSDPTHGAIFFAAGHADNIVEGKIYPSIEAGRNDVREWASTMKEGYKPEHALAQGQLYPFEFVVSEPFYVPEQGYTFLFMGNNRCIWSISCGRGYLTTDPID